MNKIIIIALLSIPLCAMQQDRPSGSPCSSVSSEHSYEEIEIITNKLSIIIYGNQNDEFRKTFEKALKKPAKSKELRLKREYYVEMLLCFADNN